MSPAATQTHEAAVEAYLAEVRAFLLTPNHASGDWPVIPNDEFEAGLNLVRQLTDLKWAQDCDGDSPINIHMVDRRRFRLVTPMVVSASPRGEETLDAEEARLMSDLRSVVCVASACGSELGHLERQLDQVRRTRATRAAAFEVFMVRYKTPADYPHQLDRPVSLHGNRADAEAFDCGEFQRESIGPYLATPDLYADPANQYGEFRAKLAAQYDRVLPFRATFGSVKLTRSVTVKSNG